MKEKVIEALKHVFDPEIPVNIWDLGLVYDINILESEIIIKMTMTSPTCPMAEEILEMAKFAAESVSDDKIVKMELVWNPPWSLDKMTEQARLELDLTEQGW